MPCPNHPNHRKRLLEASVLVFRVNHGRVLWILFSQVLPDTASLTAVSHSLVARFLMKIPSTSRIRNSSLLYVVIMATTAIRELQMAALPAAVGTVAILYSNVANMFAMGKFRYANKGVEVHPYKPWSDTTPNAEEHFRAYKAFENGMEWTVIAVPALWLYVLYTPAVPHVGKFLPWTGALLAAAFAYYNTKYLEGYAQSVEARLPPFKARTNALMVLFTGALASMAASFLTTIGIVKMITPKVCERM